MTDDISHEEAEEGSIRKLVYTGKITTLYKLIIGGFFLTVLTFGLYYPRAKVKARAYLWSSLSFHRNAFAYHAKAKDVLHLSLVALLIAVLFTLCAVSAIYLYAVPSLLYKLAAVVDGIIGIHVLFISARYAVIKHHVDHTVLRDTYFSLRGGLGMYIWLHIKHFIYNVLTIGMYAPIGHVAVLRHVLNRIYYGDVRVTYNGRAEELQTSYLLCWLLFIPTLGFSRYWYRAKYYAHVAKYTRLASIQLRFVIGGPDLMALHYTNKIAAWLTLGLGFPWVANRSLKFFVNRLHIKGALP